MPDLDLFAPERLKRFQNLSNKPPLVHTRKKCKCGKIITAKQLTIYGVCDECYNVKI